MKIDVFVHRAAVDDVEVRQVAKQCLLHGDQMYAALLIAEAKRMLGREVQRRVGTERL